MTVKIIKRQMNSKYQQIKFDYRTKKKQPDLFVYLEDLQLVS